MSRTATICQETGDIAFIERADTCIFDQGGELRRPSKYVRTTMVVKRPDSREITGENHLARTMIRNHKTPVANQATKPTNARAIVNGRGNSGVARILMQHIAELKDQLLAIVEAPIPEEDRARPVRTVMNVERL
jgi:hypothetical protein